MDNFPLDLTPPEGVELIETNTRINWYYESILHVYCKPTLHTFNDAKEQLRILKELYGDKKVPLIIDIRLAEPMEKETRLLYSSKEGCANVSAFCFIVDSSFTKAIANFFLSMRKPPVPFRMFTSVDKAKEWCNEYK